MGICILIYLFISDELSYDKFHAKSDRTYRVSRSWTNSDGEVSLHLGHLASAFGPLLINDFPGIIENSVRMLWAGEALMSYGDKKIVEQGVVFAEEDFFEIFSFKLLEGNPQTALVEPNSVVLTTETAKRYFGDEDPMGKVLNFDGQVDFKVTGIVEEAPGNSHFHYDFLVSFQTVEDFYGQDYMMTNFSSNNYATYLVLKEGYNPDDLEAQFPAFIDKSMGDFEGNSPSEGTQLHLWPITDIHLYSHLDSEIEPNGKIEYVYIYAVIGIFILLIACINFMNLSTARSARRAKEVGLRKVMGALKKSLIRQFLCESFLITVFALFVAVLFVEIALPYLNDFIEKELSLSFFNDPEIMLVLLAIGIIVGLLAGSYPAFFLSSFKPSAVLKGEYKTGGKQQLFRGSLVVLQFAISITLIVGMIIVYEQLEYVETKELGFQKENVIILPSSETIASQYEAIRDRLLKQPGISDVTHATRVPSGRLLDSRGIQAEVDGKVRQVNVRIADVSVDHDYLSALGIDIIAGRDFNRNLASDSSESFIINEATAQAIGYASPEDAIGSTFIFGEQKGSIIGVTRNFHFESLHQPIAPIVLAISDNPRRIAVRIKEEGREATLAYLEKEWRYLRPDFPFDFYTIEDNFLEQYTAEQKLGELIGYFAVIAIIIASLGLLGLASFTTEQRTREIGIRKVLGASVYEILVLLLKGFSKWVIIAFIIACPLAYFGMDKWLQNFAYHSDINIVPFIIGGLFSLLLAWFTVGFLSIKASLVNPVDSLKSE